MLDELLVVVTCPIYLSSTSAMELTGRHRSHRGVGFNAALRMVGRVRLTDTGIPSSVGLF